LSVLWLHIVTCEACVHTPHRSQYAAITLTTSCAASSTPHRSQYAAIILTTSCTAPTYLLLTKCVIFS